MPAVPLGRLLVSAGLVTQVALDEVLGVQRTERRKLGVLLVERGVVRAEQLAQMLSRQLSCPWVSLQRFELTSELRGVLPREVAVAQRVVPVHLRVANGARVLYVATDDPTDEFALTEAARAASMRVKPMVALTSEITDVLALHYGGPRPTKDTGRPSAKPKPPPPTRPSNGPPERERTPSAPMIEDDDLMLVSESAPKTPRVPRILAISPSQALLTQCQTAVKTLGANLVTGPLDSIKPLVDDNKPCAIIMADKTFALDRTGLSRLALDSDAVLVVIEEGRTQLEPLLDSALRRWGRATYAKGTVLDGRYELVRDLGGVFAGSRWEVRHVRTGRRAILRVGVKDGSDTSDVEAVKREHEALEKIQHPSGVDLRDAGTTSLGDPYIVLELIEGKSLEALVAARGKLPVVDACAVIRQAAELVQAAHEAGVAHGDLRTESIVVVRDAFGIDRVKVIGWELSTVDADSMSVRKDITDLGACAYEALLGRPYTFGEEVPKGELPEDVSKLLKRALDGNDGALEAGDVISAIDIAAPRARERQQLLEGRRRESLRPDDGRRHKRAPFRTPIRVEVPGHGSIEGRTEDISQAGVFIVTRAEIAEGASVTVRFALPVDGKVVSEDGVVRWSRAAPGAAAADLRALGIELSAPSGETAMQIERYVTAMSEPPSLK